MASFLESQRLISRKIWVARNFWNCGSKKRFLQLGIHCVVIWGTKKCQIKYLVISLVQMLLSRNFCQKDSNFPNCKYLIFGTVNCDKNSPNNRRLWAYWMTTSFGMINVSRDGFSKKSWSQNKFEREHHKYRGMGQGLA